MPMNVHHGSATIYDFASKVRAMQKNRLGAASVPAESQLSYPVTTYGGAWYHEAAVATSGANETEDRRSESKTSDIIEFDRTRGH